MVTALFVGRFQPFHKGHLHAIKTILKDFNKVIIVIGSTNIEDEKNPFSTKERIRMIKGSLEKFRNKIKVITIPDVHNDILWTKMIIDRIKFDIVVTGNGHVRRCFERFGVPVERPDFLEKRKYNGTRIRKLIYKGKGWEGLVPPNVRRIIKADAQKG